jgi:hypothetical protein
MRKQEIAIITLALWLITIFAFMLLFQEINLEIFSVLGLIGLLVIVLFMEPKYVLPDYLRYIWYLIGGGIVIFAAILVLKVLEVLAE